MNLINGDCIKEMAHIPDASVDAIITDPPYGTTQCKWDSVLPFESMWKELKRIIKPNGAIVLFGSEPFSSALRMSNIKQYKYDWIYVKSMVQNFLNVKKQPLRNNECISVFYKKQCVYNPQMRAGDPYITCRGKSGNSISSDKNITNGGHITITNGLRYPLSVMAKVKPDTGLHPTQKPVELIEYLIKTYTNEGETVLDFAMGSGTTGVACKNLNREFIGIELDKEYFNIAKNRTGKK